jgi:hypothetical protein
MKNKVQKMTSSQCLIIHAIREKQFVMQYSCLLLDDKGYLNFKLLMYSNFWYGFAIWQQLLVLMFILHRVINATVYKNKQLTLHCIQTYILLCINHIKNISHKIIDLNEIYMSSTISSYDETVLRNFIKF